MIRQGRGGKEKKKDKRRKMNEIGVKVHDRKSK